MKRARGLLILLVLALVGAGIYFYVNRQPDQLTITGIVDGNEVVVSAQITGRIQSLTVQEGQHVKAGDLIATLDHQDLTAAVQAASAAASQASQVALQARDQITLTRASIAARIMQADAQVQQTAAQQAQADANYRQAESNYQRALPLFDEGIVTAQDRDNAKATRDAAKAGADAAAKALAAAKAALADAQAQQHQVQVQRRQLDASQAAVAQADASHAESVALLDRAEIHAPVSGVVSLRAAREGEVVKPGDPIVTIFELGDTWVQADVEETYADLVSLGQTLTVRMPSGAEVSGPVIYKAVEADFATQRDVSQTKRDIKTVAIRIRVPNQEGRLARGMTAYVVLPLAQPPRGQS
ncbi:MAG TPA: efflux RND transporter periplasmic adaptor subunit [Vicinamibacterales bacterium]|jgi:multidrug resistance efflux pump